MYENIRREMGCIREDELIAGIWITRISNVRRALLWRADVEPKRVCLTARRDSG